MGPMGWLQTCVIHESESYLQISEPSAQAHEQEGPSTDEERA